MRCESVARRCTGCSTVVNLHGSRLGVAAELDQRISRCSSNSTGVLHPDRQFPTATEVRLWPNVASFHHKYVA